MLRSRDGWPASSGPSSGADAGSGLQHLRVGPANILDRSYVLGI
jgi:hypothetical protein